jgi:RNA polymerase sigma-70 factor (ECF subfamily)
MVWNPAEADDVLQETNLVLWEKAGEFDSARPFLPWAMRFAQFQALAWLKRRQRQQVVFDSDLACLLADEAVKDELAFEDRRQALASCLQKLPAEHRDLIARRYGDWLPCIAWPHAGRCPQAGSEYQSARTASTTLRSEGEAHHSHLPERWTFPG